MVKRRIVKALVTALSFSTILASGLWATDTDEVMAQKATERGRSNEWVKVKAAQGTTEVWWSNYITEKICNQSLTMINYVKKLTSSSKSGDKEAALWFLKTGGKHGFAKRKVNKIEADILKASINAIVDGIATPEAGASPQKLKEIPLYIEALKNLVDQTNHHTKMFDNLSLGYQNLSHRVSNLDQQVKGLDSLVLGHTRKITDLEIEFKKDKQKQNLRIQDLEENNREQSLKNKNLEGEITKLNSAWELLEKQNQELKQGIIVLEEENSGLTKKSLDSLQTIIDKEKPLAQILMDAKEREKLAYDYHQKYIKMLQQKDNEIKQKNNEIKQKEGIINQHAQEEQARKKKKRR